MSGVQRCREQGHSYFVVRHVLGGRTAGWAAIGLSLRSTIALNDEDQVVETWSSE